jgi:hypothetical protein
MSPGIQHAASLSLSALLRWKWAGVQLSYRGAIQRQSGIDLNSFHFDANARIAPHGYRERRATHAAVSVPELWQALRRRGNGSRIRGVGSVGLTFSPMTDCPKQPKARPNNKTDRASMNDVYNRFTVPQCGSSANLESGFVWPFASSSCEMTETSIS